MESNAVVGLIIIGIAIWYFATPNKKDRQAQNRTTIIHSGTVSGGGGSSSGSKLFLFLLVNAGFSFLLVGYYSVNCVPIRADWNYVFYPFLPLIFLCFSWFIMIPRELRKRVNNNPPGWFNFLGIIIFIASHYGTFTQLDYC